MKLRDELDWGPPDSSSAVCRNQDWYRQPDWVLLDGSYLERTRRGMSGARAQPAGGPGTRLYPITRDQQAAAAGVRQADDLLTAQRADAGGIREVLIINTPHEQALFKALGDGSWGMKIKSRCSETDGLVQAFLIEGVLAPARVLGDNIFHGPGPHCLRADQRAGRDGVWLLGQDPALRRG